MTDVTDRLRAFLTTSPSVVFPDEVLELFEPVETEMARLSDENAKLRKLVQLTNRRLTPISPCKDIPCGECPVKDECDQEDALMRELGIEVAE